MSHFDAHSLSLHDALPIFTSPSITFSPGSCRYSASSPYHNARPPRKRGSGQRPDPRTMRLRLFLEVEPQAHLNVSGRIVLVTGNTKGARPGYVHARLVREIRITSTAEHDVVEGVDKLYVKPCGEAFGDARHLR